MRTKITDAVKTAMREKEHERLSTLRLMNAAIKDRDIKLREAQSDACCSDDEILSILGRMVKQRQESALIYEKGERLDLAKKERAEIKVIEEFLPKQMSEGEVIGAIDRILSGIESPTLRDMGRIMSFLKQDYTGQMDFGKAGALIKKRLN